MAQIANVVFNPSITYAISSGNDPLSPFGSNPNLTPPSNKWVIANQTITGTGIPANGITLFSIQQADTKKYLTFDSSASAISGSDNSTAYWQFFNPSASAGSSTSGYLIGPQNTNMFITVNGDQRTASPLNSNGVYASQTWQVTPIAV